MFVRPLEAVVWSFGMVSNTVASKLHTDNFTFWEHLLSCLPQRFLYDILDGAFGFHLVSICKSYVTGWHCKQHSQRTFICSKSTMKVPEQCMKSVQCQQKRPKNSSNKWWVNGGVFFVYLNSNGVNFVRKPLVYYERTISRSGYRKNMRVLQQQLKNLDLVSSGRAFCACNDR